MKIRRQYMKNFIKTLLILLPALSVFSCKVDTYALPDACLHGSLVCSDGSTLITEQPNGFKIRLREIVGGEVAVNPQDFWGKADGTFRNSKIFAGDYVIQPIDGAFFEVDPVEMKITGDTELNFEITPYCTITASYTVKGSDLIVKYRIQKDPKAGKITTARVLVSKWNPNVGMNYVDKEAVRDLSGAEDDKIQKTTYTETILGFLEQGVKYYARVAVLCSNTAGRYNMTAVEEIVTE